MSNSTFKEQTQDRIAIKGIRADDIKHQGRMDLAQIQDIPHEKVYEWVKTGAWKKKDFETWLRAMRVIE